ncbi:MAG: DUF72 domain-containing protein [Planctomycetota bacterium]|jgi:uncharacterized protein YecE (DUF72 family)
MSIDVPESIAPHLRIGTCSWKYDSWKGLYYDREKQYKPNDYLADYAKHLNSVEVDQWFWSLFPGGIKLPDPALVQRYSESVSQDFRFSVKAPNSITLTHYYNRQPKAYASHAGRPNPHFLDNDLLERFLEQLQPMGHKLGPIMFQFEYLNRKKMSDLNAFLDRFHDFIEKAPRGFQYAVETRNPNYLSQEFFAFLKAHGLGFVYLEGYYMPHIGKIFETLRPVGLDPVVIRLHGGDRKDIEKLTQENWDRVVAPKPEGIDAAVRIVCENMKRKTSTYVNVNNHFEGSAPITIERFLEELSLKY